MNLIQASSAIGAGDVGDATAFPTFIYSCNCIP